MSESSDETIVRVGDTIRFSAVLLEEMTTQDYPLVRILDICTAPDGSKVLTLRLADESDLQETNRRSHAH